MAMTDVDENTDADAGEALPGRATPMPVPEFHHVSGARLAAPYPPGTEVALFGLAVFGAPSVNSGRSRVLW